MTPMLDLLYLLSRLTKCLYSCVFYHKSIVTSISFQHLPLSSQCVTLGSRNFDNWILWLSPLLYERCTFEGESAKNGVIPMRDTGIQYKNICRSYDLQGILGEYIKNNFYGEVGWIPVSRTGMTGKRILDDRRKSTGMTEMGLLGQQDFTKIIF